MIGIIGGSGLDNPDILEKAKDIKKDTPYGETSSALKHGFIAGTEVLLLARHGREHTISPTGINNRANIWALKELGCTQIIATTAVGSLREKIKPGELVLPDQFIDFTRHRAITFFDSFEPGEMKHAQMADPFNKKMCQILNTEADKLQIPIHNGATVVTIEGPRFSTRAESHMFRAWGAHIINMSTAPECILANELKIPYAAVAMSTDYDCWNTNQEPVSWEAVLKTFNANVGRVTDLLIHSIPKL